MSSPFLLAFTEAVLRSLDERELVEIAAGSHASVVAFVAGRLGSAREGDSLISSLSAALLASPEVIELYADNQTLKEVVTDLPRGTVPGGAR